MMRARNHKDLASRTLIGDWTRAATTGWIGRIGAHSTIYCLAAPPRPGLQRIRVMQSSSNGNEQARQRVSSEDVTARLWCIQCPQLQVTVLAGLHCDSGWLPAAKPEYVERLPRLCCTEHPEVQKWSTIFLRLENYGLWDPDDVGHHRQVRTRCRRRPTVGCPASWALITLMISNGLGHSFAELSSWSQEGVSHEPEAGSDRHSYPEPTCAQPTPVSPGQTL